MKTVSSGSSLITVVINKSDMEEHVKLNFGSKNPEGTLIFSNRQGKLMGTTLQIGQEETMVVEWK